MRKNKNVIIIIVLLIIAGGFFVWGSMTSPKTSRTWSDTNIFCLPNGHQNLAVHIHPQLSITVDGQPEELPANLGITQNCMAELHTHDVSGEIHVETVDAGRIDDLTLGDFFNVWDRPLERDGYNLTAYVDGAEVDDPSSITFEDHQQINLEYTSSGTETNNGNSGDNDSGGDFLTLAESCQNEAGTWLNEHVECEGVGQVWCDSEGGEFEECASACRHDGDVEVCTLQCVQVCSFQES